MIDANCQKVSAKARFDSDFRVRATVSLIRLRASPAPAQFEDQESTGEAHFILGQEGWQNVADYVLGWALCRANPESKLSAVPNRRGSWSLEFFSV